MKIGAFKKITLNNFPNEVSSCLWTLGCNLRCKFCHNVYLLDSKTPSLNSNDILRQLYKIKNLVSGICFSGGEPLLQRDLSEFIQILKVNEFKIKIDTNGTYPARMKTLLANGYIDYIAMDIKGKFEDYKEITQRDISTELLRHSVDIIYNSGIKHEFRITVVDSLHKEEDLYEIGSLLAGSEGKLILQPFQKENALCPFLRESGKSFPIETLELIAKDISNLYIESYVRS